MTPRARGLARVALVLSILGGAYSCAGHAMAASMAEAHVDRRSVGAAVVYMVAFGISLVVAVAAAVALARGRRRGGSPPRLERRQNEAGRP